MARSHSEPAGARSLKPSALVLALLVLGVTGRAHAQAPANEPTSTIGEPGPPVSEPGPPLSEPGLPLSEPGSPNSEVAIRRTQIVEAPVASKSPADPEALALSAKIDAIVYEAVQDLGLNVDISQRASLREHESDEELLAAAKDSWLLAPRLERNGGRWLLHLVAVPPGSRVLYSSSVVVEPELLEKRIVLSMRDLIEAARGSKASPSAAPPPPPSAQPAAQAHSPGRAILAVNSALLGGFVGYSLQRASGSSDDRLTYPLAALGAGVGLGSALLVAEEWDIEVGDAWFLSAGMLWPTVSASFIARGYNVSRANAYAYGLLGSTAGVALATTALGFGHVSEGGAALAHSGGLFGTLVGGLVDLSIQGKTDVRPRLGMGYGAGAGVLVASAIATQVHISPNRVLMIDLGASLGGLTGAAAASPLLLVDESAASSARRNRMWLASVAAGTLVGGAAGVWFTRGSSTSAAARPPFLPSVGVIGMTPEGSAAYGASVHGTW